LINGPRRSNLLVTCNRDYASNFSFTPCFSWVSGTFLKLLKPFERLDAADKVANLMGCKSPAVSYPNQTASISDVREGNDTHGARK